VDDIEMITVEQDVEGKLLLRCDRVGCRRRGFYVSPSPTDLRLLVERVQAHVREQHDIEIVGSVRAHICSVEGPHVHVWQDYRCMARTVSCG